MKKLVLVLFIAVIAVNVETKKEVTIHVNQLEESQECADRKSRYVYDSRTGTWRLADVLDLEEDS